MAFSLYFFVFIFLNWSVEQFQAGNTDYYLLSEAASFVIGPGLFNAAAELRALSVQLPGRLGEDLPVARSGVLHG